MLRLQRLACLAALFAAASFAAPAATVTVTRQKIKTYPFSDPDPVPAMARQNAKNPDASIYPYTRFEGFSKQAVEREWTVVRLENPYLVVDILPEVGGKIWGAREKTTGREFIYTNHVLKFRQIAMRGPWTSGGIEFNFGIIGHAPSCATPVDYVTAQAPDGSARCTVGTMDLPSRTRWSVTITLPQDKAWFETATFFTNPTPWHQAYYNWMNTAAHVGDDLQYSFPGTQWIEHNFAEAPRPWPVDGGRDLSLYRNNDFGSSKSYFSFGQYRDFFGVYWHDPKLGFGHWAHYDDVPGHKVWIWALSREGGIWEQLLTDRDGQYSEPQAGRYLNQSDTAFFQPGASDRWREVWFPFKETGPLSAATPAGALNVTTSTLGLELTLCPLQKIDDDLVVTQGSQTIFRERLRLDPMQVWRRTLTQPAPHGTIRVELAQKLSWTSDPHAADLRRPFHFQQYTTETAEGEYLRAEALEQGRHFTTALAGYLALLEKDPQHLRALCRVAEIHARRAQDAPALAYARQALQISHYDPQANFIYGALAQRRGEWIDAKETFGWAARSMEYRSAAYGRIGEVLLAEKRYAESEEYARRALESNTLNVDARLALAIALRKQGQTKAAQQELAALLAIDPLNHHARFEIHLIEPRPEALAAFQKPIHNELPQETYLEMAATCVRMGLAEEAIAILKRAPPNPEIQCWLAYLLRDRSPEESRKTLEQAGALSPRLVFPFRPESIPVFQWAMAQRPADWTPKYYLGLLLWGLGRAGEARALFAQCGAPDFAPFYLIQAALAERRDPAAALTSYKTARQKDRGEWRTWHALAAAYLNRAMTAEALATAHEGAAAFPDQDTLRIDLVKALLAAGRHQEASELLDRTTILPFEGADEVHQLFVTCQLRLAREKLNAGQPEQALQLINKGREYPERLGTGRPYAPAQRELDRLQALALEKMGHPGSK